VAAQDDNYAQIEIEIVRAVRSLNNVHAKQSIQIPGLTSNEARLIMHSGTFFKRHKQYPQARELGRVMGLSPSAISQLLRSCEQKGYIERTHSQNDARVTLVQLRPRGKNVYLEGVKIFYEQIHQLEHTIGIKDLQELLRILRRIQDFWLHQETTSHHSSVKEAAADDRVAGGNSLTGSSSVSSAGTPFAQTSPKEDAPCE